jgi:hypothetical protein
MQNPFFRTTFPTPGTVAQQWPVQQWHARMVTFIRMTIVFIVVYYTVQFILNIIIDTPQASKQRTQQQQPSPISPAPSASVLHIHHHHHIIMENDVCPETEEQEAPAPLTINIVPHKKRPGLKRIRVGTRSTGQ